MERIRNRLRALSPCIGFAVAYGSVTAGCFGGLVLYWSAVWARRAEADAGRSCIDGALPGWEVMAGPLWALVGAVLGAVAGSIAGCGAGGLGYLLRGRLGWGVAGALGGLPAASLPLLSVVLDPYAADPGELLATLLLWLAPALIGGAIGVAVGAGLERGRSPLSGVTRLATALAEAESRPALPGGRPTEVTPAMSPEGRGDEGAPS